jgi:predicted RecA/RadA family phage recombinase
MAFPGVRFFVVGAIFFVSACSFAENTLWPSLTGESPTATKQSAAGQTPAKSAQMKQAPAGGSQPVIVAQNPPPLGTTNFQPVSVTPGQATGTYVGKKVIDLRQELKRLQQSISNNNGLLQSLRGKIVANSQRYHGTIAAVNARLQVGTTPGNPILVQQFNSAQADLDRIAADITEMNALANRVSNNSTMSSFLSESARASFTVSGAVDEDHRQLAILEDEVNRTDVLISRLLKEVSSDVRRQTNYVATERANLNLVSAAIRSGEIFGGSLVNKALASATAGRSGNIAARPMSTAGKRPLVVIRFDRAKVPYQQALYNAVSRVLEGSPSAVFDLVAVAPTAGGTAKMALNSNKARRHAEEVLRALIEMGLPPARVAVSAKTLSAAKTNEVHVYLR